MKQISRRSFLVLGPLALAACTTERGVLGEATRPRVDPKYVAMYGPLPDEKFPIPAIDVSRIDPRLFRQMVSYPTSESPGTLIVDPSSQHLYLVQENGMALRYGVGVGRAGYDYEGRATVGRKAMWPRWTPTATMIAEDPITNGPWAGGMEPGLQNPLGARALYLFKDGRDTLYRIHGTNDPRSIGRSVSSGCIRLFNQDIVDLYARVPVGSPVLVLNAPLSS